MTKDYMKSIRSSNGIVNNIYIHIEYIPKIELIKALK